MAKHSTLNKLRSEGLTCRDIELRDQEGAGFVVRVYMRHLEPKKVVTVARQPGHETTTVDTHTVSYRGGFGWDERLIHADPSEQLGLEAVTAYLHTQAENNPLAKVALQHFDTPTEA